MPGSNQRWCSDKMTIACWNGEIVELAFALDCRNREAMAIVAEARPIGDADIRRLIRKAVFARFGNDRPLEAILWLSDNEGIRTALEKAIEAEKLKLSPTMASVACPDSNGLTEAFVNILRRDFLDEADRSTAARMLEQIPVWIGHYNKHAPHLALGYHSSIAYRREKAAELVNGRLTT
jgi:putative transposase